VLLGGSPWAPMAEPLCFGLGMAIILLYKNNNISVTIVSKVVWACLAHGPYSISAFGHGLLDGVLWLGGCGEGIYKQHLG